MEPVIYHPYWRKHSMVFIAVILSGCLVLLCIGFRPKELVAYLLLAICAAIDAMTLRGSVSVDQQGLHIVYPRKGEVVSISWSRIHDCRFFPGGYGTPSICVLFQNPGYIVYGRCLRTTDNGIRMGREGGKVLCDSSLRKLAFGFMTPEEFADRDVFGITVTEAEYKQICKWWIERINTPSG